MKIRYTDLSSKSGTTEFIENTVGKTLIAMGHAEEVKLPARGSAGWLEARLEQSRRAGPPDPHDVPAGYTEGVAWGVRDKVHPAGEVLIIRKAGFETQFFSEPPKDCPKSIVAKFEAVKNGDGARFEALEEAKKKQAAHDAKISTARRW